MTGTVNEETWAALKGAIALQSARLQFFHPVSGEKMEFALAMPAGEPWDYFI